jgi:hypothetical protein
MARKQISLELVNKLETIQVPDTSLLEQYDMFERGDNSHILFDWVVGNTCNYSCTYCNPSNYDGSSPWPTLDVFKNFATVSTNYYKRIGRDIRWNLLGGELSVWKDFPEALQILKELDSSNLVQWQTNGARSLRWWKKNTPLFNSVLISYHPEESDYKHITEVINILGEGGIDVGLNIMVYPPLADTCFEAAEYIMNNTPSTFGFGMKALQRKLGIDPRTFVYEPELLKRMEYYEKLMHGKEISTGQLQEIMYWVNKTTGKRVQVPDVSALTIDGTNTWRGWDCNIGIDKINIKDNGSITSGSSCNPDIHHGDILFPEKITFPSQPIVCNYDWCPCGSDMAVTKKKQLIA